MRAQDGVTFSNISATTAAFPLQGGLYQFSAVATWNSSGTVTLQQLGPDGSTYLSVSAALSANGGVTVYLPPGQYQVAVATATVVYAGVARIPLE